GHRHGLPDVEFALAVAGIDGEIEGVAIAIGCDGAKALRTGAVDVRDALQVPAIDCHFGCARRPARGNRLVEHLAGGASRYVEDHAVAVLAGRNRRATPTRGPRSLRDRARESATAAGLAPALPGVPLVVQDFRADGRNGELPVRELAALHLAGVQPAAHFDGQCEISR